MYEILRKQMFPPNIKMLQVKAPAVARKAQPGQFVIIRTNQKGERIPITIAGADPAREAVTIYLAEVGVSSQELGQHEEGEHILNFSGPLGNPIPILEYGGVLCVGGGVFQGANHYLAERLSENGNTVTCVLYAKRSDHFFLTEEVEETCSEVHYATEDGSKGHGSLDFMNRLLRAKKFDRVFAFGPTPMQRAVSEMTRPLGIPTSVNLFPIMVDGTGMCGACRVTVGGATRFACIDGPEFDGHQVDFDELVSRMRYYTAQEKVAMVLQERGVV
ncbi:sulfide/dihydroorotate dehydrogenase-like FAD/NAD-binding protein [Candidatus Bathyarchaeota archaeon]|nr:sulfide/dihydroorotate dehydrogenase-like FAD/NAD-binding protein [Candidatus Bathyarchaeota archaeon]